MTDAAELPAQAAPPPTLPLYWRMLRLRHIRPNGWQRALLVEGVLTTAVILALADVASAWTLLALPLASIVIVKGHDLLVGWLPTAKPPTPLPPPRIGDYVPWVAVAALIVLVKLVR